MGWLIQGESHSRQGLKVNVTDSVLLLLLFVEKHIVCVGIYVNIYIVLEYISLMNTLTNNKGPLSVDNMTGIC